MASARLGLLALGLAPLLGCALRSEPQREGLGLSAVQPREERPVIPPATPVPPGLEHPVQQARDDLARRLGLDPSGVQVVEARTVVWPDAGLGCPRPGVAYPQRPRDGLLVRLAAAGRIYAYHGGDGRPPFLCEHPAADGGAPGRGE